MFSSDNPLYRVLKAARLLAAVIIAAGGCSSDTETPVGSEFLSDSTLGSRPGVLFEETILLSAEDTSFVVSSTLTSNAFLTLGIKDGYKSSVVLQVDLADTILYTGKIVSAAFLKLRFTDQASTQVLGARFFEMMEPYSESDTLTELSMQPNPIPDSGLQNVDREINLLGSYSLPKDMAQAWIDGSAVLNGIVVIPSDTALSTQITFGSRENGDAGLKPFLNVDFDDGTSANFPVSGDATFVESQSQSANLIISDGVTRRTFLPVDLGAVPENAVIHKAELILHRVPGSFLGNEFEINIYVPGSSIIGDPALLSGTGVTISVIDTSSAELSLSVRNVLLQFIDGVLLNNGFVLRYNSEGSQIKQAEFYSSASDSALRPSISLTYSSPPHFDD